MFIVDDAEGPSQQAGKTAVGSGPEAPHLSLVFLTPHTSTGTITSTITLVGIREQVLQNEKAVALQ